MYPRAAILSQWLLDTFGGVEALGAGCGVLDVAGGRGDLSCALVCSGVSSTVIDPRQNAGVNAKTRQAMRKANDERAGREGGPGMGKFAVVHHFFGEHLLSKPDELERLAASAAAAGGFVPSGMDAHANMDSKNTPRASLNDLLSMQSLIQNCSLIIGLHPDQVTDSIVDVAIASGKPFAVVPCCVFSRQFPERRTPAGDHVASHEDLIEYLAAKHPSVQTQRLPFDGCNTVVFATAATPVTIQQPCT